MYVAVSRKTEGGNIFGPEQRVTRAQALRMMTSDAAFLSFDEKQRGSIEPGKLADLTILSDDFMACEEEAIRRIKPVATVVGGKIVYQRE
jgi:predicted amidohydrolase YtcJ